MKKEIEEAKKKLADAQDALVKIVGEKIVAYFAPIFVHLSHQSGEAPVSNVLTEEEIAEIDAAAVAKINEVIAAQKAEIEAAERAIFEAAQAKEKPAKKTKGEAVVAEAEAVLDAPAEN